MIQLKRDQLIEYCKNLGFSHIGISPINRLDEEVPKLEKWLSSGFHGQMGYMENHFEMRLNPELLLPGAKSIISLSYNYFHSKKPINTDSLKISQYAYGEDYHLVIKEKLKLIVRNLQKEIGQFQARVFVDSAPILERVWAKKSGLGWIGKNTLLLNKNMGSFFFLAEIVCDISFDQYDGPTTDHCGTCTACIDACPTDAIIEPYQLDASKCISYLTIELKDKIPDEFNGKMNDWIFGCDVCQDVCPWNRHSKPHNEPRFEPSQKMMELSKSDWNEITEDLFNELFKNSPIKRTKYAGLKRNIAFVQENNLKDNNITK